MAPGSAKDAGGFRLGALAKAATVYLVESAIDAISLARLRAAAGEKGFAIISTAGTTPQPRRWFAGIAETVRRVCAFDNDRAGDKAAEGLLRHRFERLRPRGKDWNDDLRAATKGQSEGGAANPAPTTEVLKAAWAALAGGPQHPKRPTMDLCQMTPNWAFDPSFPGRQWGSPEGTGAAAPSLRMQA